MKKNLYYRKVIRRENLFNKFIFAFFLGFASWPRLLLEVFIRKNFGERYFKLSSAITVAFILIGIPFLLHGFHNTIAFMNDDGDTETNINAAPNFYKAYYGWFAFVGLFLIVSYIRWQEIRKNPSVFDFAKFSLYAGDISPIFSNLKLGVKKASTRLIETILEPLPFLILGVILYFLGQKLGILLIVSSVCYCLGYVAAYDHGDNFVMDKIDEIICNEELKNAFVDGMDEKQTRGFRFVGNVPEKAEQRTQLLPLMTEDDEESAVAK
jgi:hypothetical protein